MAKKSKLLTALDRHQGRDFDLERQRKLRKQAEKRKSERPNAASSDLPQSKRKSSGKGAVGSEKALIFETENQNGITLGNLNTAAADSDKSDEEEVVQKTGVESAQLQAEEGIEEQAEEEDEDDDSQEEYDDVALSDIDSLASSEKADVIPYQKLTINNTTALLAAHKTIALPLNLPFSTNQVLTTDSPVEVPDVNDDLTRELAFYKQCLSGAEKGRKLLKQEGIPFSRPSDYFAEMVKSDEHMGKIKRKMVEDAGAKKASQEARRQRDLKKFGKQVQVAKEQERAKEKRATLAKIDLLKRKRKSGDMGGPHEEDQFDVALEDATKETSGRSNNHSKDSQRPGKRLKKDQKFGFGGKKRFAKSGDAISSGDVSGFSAKNMKGKWQKAKRPGKSKRAKVS